MKFTKPGGRIHVWCKEKFADEKQVVYEFGCADNGPGMSQEFVAHAFDLFTQEKETSRSKYEGEDPSFSPKPYYQVFQGKHGFLPNMSIVDLLFNMGPEGLLVLRDSIVASKQP